MGDPQGIGTSPPKCANTWMGVGWGLRGPRLFPAPLPSGHQTQSCCLNSPLLLESLPGAGSDGMRDSGELLQSWGGEGTMGWEWDHMPNFTYKTKIKLLQITETTKDPVPCVGPF